jgi:FAD/FMN-containing dehydrogenase
MHIMKQTWLGCVALAILISAIIQCAGDNHGSQYSSSPSLDHGTLQAIVAELKTLVKGKVYIRGSYGYEKRRPVHNGACRNIYPAIIVVPLTTEDVSYAVKAAVKYNLPVSFRSGGHSFICQGIRQDALHIDVRQIDHVNQVSDHQINFGSGANFGKILKVVSPERYTMIHGQSLTVGVAGFLQGVGVNPMGTSQRYGFGSDHVLEYTMVLADGSIAKVNKYNTTILPSSK